MMTGWIKISREITNHWIAQDPQKFLWWIDLIIMASHDTYRTSYRSRVFTLKIGSLHATLTFLAARWKVNRKTVLRFVKLLESEGMIKRKQVDYNVVIITICNYARYQAPEKYQMDDTEDCETDTETDTETDFQTDGQIPLQTDGQLAATGESKVDVKQEYIYNQPTNRREVEEKKFFEELKDLTVHRDYWNALAAKYEKGFSELAELFDRFAAANKEKQHRGIEDLKSHFDRWMQIQTKYEEIKQKTYKPETQNGTDKRKPNTKRAGVDELLEGENVDWEGGF